MPTRGRQKWAAQAVDCYRAQTYADRELIVIDDEDDRSFPSGLEAPNITYVLQRAIRRNIPQKLNDACQLARGQVIAKWDSDDWYAPERIADEVQMLRSSGKAVAGYNTILFFNESTQEVREYRGNPIWASGTSLCFRKDWWQQHPFIEQPPIGSDTRFSGAAEQERQTVTKPSGQTIVARLHPGNTAPKRGWRSYHPKALSDLPEGFLRLLEVTV